MYYVFVDSSYAAGHSIDVFYFLFISEEGECVGVGQVPSSLEFKHSLSNNGCNDNK